MNAIHMVTSVCGPACRKGGDFNFALGAGTKCLADHYRGRRDTSHAVTFSVGPDRVLEIDDEGELRIAGHEVESSERTLEALGVLRGWLADSKATGARTIRRLAGALPVTSCGPLTFTTSEGDPGFPAGSVVFKDATGDVLRFDPGQILVCGQPADPKSAGEAFLRWILGPA